MEAGRVGRDAATAEVVVRRRGGIGGANGGDARHIVASECDVGGESPAPTGRPVSESNLYFSNSGAS